MLNVTQLSKAIWLTISNSRQGLKDTLVSAIPQLVGVFTGFFGSVLIARGLGPTGMGQYALVMSLAGVAGTLSDLGIGQTAIRYASMAAASKDKRMQMSMLRWALRWRLSLVLLVTTAFFFMAPYIARFWNSEALTFYMRLGLLGGIFGALASVPSIYFQSIRQFSTNAFVNSAQRIISFAGIIVLSLFSLWSLLNLMVVNLVVSALGAFAFLMLVPKAAVWPQDAMRKLKGVTLKGLLSSPQAQHKANNGLDSTSASGFLAFQIVSSIVVMATLQADVWMMGYFINKSQIGIYSVATRFTLPLTIALSALNTALWPRASGTADPEQLLRLMKRTMGLCVLMSSMLALYSVFAPIFAPLLFGTAYEKSRFLGQLLCFRYCLSILICPLGIIAYSLGYVKVVWIINIAQFGVVISINLFFLPRIGILASAIALLANEITGGVLAGIFFTYKYRQLRRAIRKKEIN